MTLFFEECIACCCGPVWRRRDADKAPDGLQLWRDNHWLKAFCVGVGQAEDFGQAQYAESG